MSTVASVLPGHGAACLSWSPWGASACHAGSSWLQSAPLLIRPQPTASPGRGVLGGSPPCPPGSVEREGCEEGEEPRPEATVWQEPQKLPPRANRCRRPQATAVSGMLFLLVGQTLIPRGLGSRAQGGLRTPEPPSAGRAPKEAFLQPCSPRPTPFPSQPAFPCLPQTSPGVAWCLPSCSGRQTHLSFVSAPKGASAVPGVGRGAHLLSMTAWPGEGLTAATHPVLPALCSCSARDCVSQPWLPLRPSPTKEAQGAGWVPATSLLPSPRFHVSQMLYRLPISQRRLWLVAKPCWGPGPDS